MTDPRIKRVDRLIAIRKRLQERAAAEHAVAQQALIRAVEDENTWYELAAEAQSSARPDEFERRSQCLLNARDRVQRSEDVLRVASEQINAASRSLKQSEVLLDRVQQQAGEEERRAEQRIQDDLRPRRST